jgi:dynein heavy chain, axonemal
MRNISSMLSETMVATCHAPLQVEGMQAELQELQPVLEKTAKEVEEMMKQIDEDKAAAAETKAQVEVQEANANEKAASAKAIAEDAQVQSHTVATLCTLLWSSCATIDLFFKDLTFSCFESQSISVKATGRRKLD